MSETIYWCPNYLCYLFPITCVPVTLLLLSPRCLCPHYLYPYCLFAHCLCYLFPHYPYTPATYLPIARATCAPTTCARAETGGDMGSAATKPENHKNKTIFIKLVNSVQKTKRVSTAPPARPISREHDLMCFNSKRVIEIEKFKYEIADIRDAFLTHQKTRHVDFTRLRPAVTLPATFFSPGTVREHVITLQREPPSFTKYKLTAETVENLKQPSFDVWQWEPNEMLVLIEYMYQDLGLMEEFCVTPPTLRNFLVCVQENYRNNPFHNFRHCFCVTQMMYSMIHLCRLQEKLSRKDLGILLTACVCHDLDHPGYNNWYQINARTELAVRYNDSSPLENHHCAVSFRVLANPECNIFSSVPEQLFKEIRACTQMIFFHYDIMWMRNVVMKVMPTRGGFYTEKVVDAKALYSIWYKEVMLRNRECFVICYAQKYEACDISNEVRPSKVAEPWVDCLLEEYFNQAEEVLVVPLRSAREHYEQLKEQEEDMRRLNQNKSIA
ncbi:high affinity cGMP-specific 3',5'-cyclic phosphodiesterase 9A-like [Penaeus monodon]|uniref:high affinity cGMP-specific 3',5'-cyclic phosphodiesterase 9A-like n=1 Tax=Penaeus monodon TaxID=6687 RepID=UPI0018A772B1|nr:high affinity cGMP-specific 3',5'-cyclic phosphodiesterase 9A-like [Penaeus monodon]